MRKTWSNPGFSLVLCLLPALAAGAGIGSCRVEPVAGEIALDIAWRTPVRCDANQAMRLDGKAILVAERYGGGACAIDCENGEILWRLADTFTAETDVVRSGDRYYCFEQYGTASPAPDAARIAVLKPDGSFDHFMIAGDRRCDSPFFCQLAAWGGKLYFLNSMFIEDAGTRRRAVMEADPSTDSLRPVYSYDVDQEPYLMFAMLVEDGIFYYSKNSASQEYDAYKARIGALDLESATVRWETTCAQTRCVPAHSMIIDGDKLYFTGGYGFGILDKTDGRIVYESDEGVTEDCGATLWNGKLYMTNNIQSTEERFGIFCNDAATGVRLWGSTRQDGALGLNPQVNEGVVYVAGQTRMMMFDADNGDYLGYDPNVRGHLWQGPPTIRYRDLMLINNGSEVVAVRMNHHREAPAGMRSEGG